MSQSAFPDGVMVTHRFLVPLFQVRVLVGEREEILSLWLGIFFYPQPPTIKRLNRLILRRLGCQFVAEGTGWFAA